MDKKVHGLHVVQDPAIPVVKGFWEFDGSAVVDVRSNSGCSPE